MNTPASQDITRTTLVILIIGVLIAGSLWTLLPFIGAFIWATTLVVATWPLLLWIQRHASGRRSVAVTVMTLGISLIVIVPFGITIGALVEASANGIDIVRSYMVNGISPPPAWLAEIPVVGARLVEKWHELENLSPGELVALLRPYAQPIAAWMAAVTGGIGGLILHFLLTIIIVGILYARGETAAQGVMAFARRLGRDRGEHAVILAGQSVRSVALGVVVTALVQSLLAGLGLLVSGIPHPGLLTAIAFVLGIAQLGPLLVLAPAVIWLYSTGSFGWATALLIWSIPVIIMDNFLRPVLISRGVDLPMLLIIAGVIGGLIGFGVIGLFAGPVVLAVTYTLLQGWIKGDVGQ